MSDKGLTINQTPIKVTPKMVDNEGIISEVEFKNGVIMNATTNKHGSIYLFNCPIKINNNLEVEFLETEEDGCIPTKTQIKISNGVIEILE